MSRVVIDQKKVEAHVIDQIVEILTEIGKEGRDFAKGQTPVKTGFAQRSVYFVVMDERGNVLAGDTHDENGQAIPNYLPQHANNRFRVFVGANAEYYIWIEIGARGRAGKAVLARTSELLTQRAKMAFRERGFEVR